MAKKTSAIGESGVRHVNGIVDEWNSVWIRFPDSHDIGIDGFIQIDRIKTRGKVTTHLPTGVILLVQIKTGKSFYKVYKSRPGYIGVAIGKKELEKHRPIWTAYPE